MSVVSYSDSGNTASVFEPRSQWPVILRPWMMRGSIMPIATTSKIWMKPPIVKELMDPRSQSTMKISANVDTICLHGLKRVRTSLTLRRIRLVLRSGSSRMWKAKRATS